MAFAPIRATESPALAGAPGDVLPNSIDSILGAGKHAVRGFCEGSTK